MTADDRIARIEQATRWEPAEAEARIFERWRASGAFSPDAEGEAGETYSIAIPPPNVTGRLHMGHALNGTIQDLLIRKARMEGRNTLWLLGTDHAGIATQMMVEKDLAKQGTSRQELGRDAFLERVWAWRDKHGSEIVEQFSRLGASVDYDRERFTLDPGYVRAVYRVFKALFDKGYIYRDNYMVNWDPGSRSAISDLEVENREVEDTLYAIRYPVDGTDRVLTVATVRPETMLADTAVAVHPDDERYRHLVGSEVVLPLVGRRIPVIADKHVDPEFGTGALKITPGHDPNDFEIGRTHGLAEISVIGEDGRMNAEAGAAFEGMTTAAAQEAIATALEAEGRLRSTEPYMHSVPFSHRSGQRIEPLISLQWFCRMDELAGPAIEAVEQGRVRFHPERWGRVYLDWMRNIRPWCVSRQLWWGHRLPVWYCDACDETYVAETEPDACGACNGELRQDEDVLDTWFSSALWPFATLGWPDEQAPDFKAFYPTDVLSTARDIIYLWVARMIMMGLEFADDVPFTDVNIHSVIQAPDGRRMSKSLGTGIDPLDVIDTHGADALRFGLAAMSSSQDVRYSEAKVAQGRDLATKLWNASRLILLGVDPEAEPAPRLEREEDRWIASRLQRAITEIRGDIERFDFAHAALELYRFFWSELCDWYLEMVKPRLYEREPAVSSTLVWVLGEVLALAHPLMPYVTEEIHSLLPGTPDGELLATKPFPEADDSLLDAEAERRIGDVIEVTVALRRWRDLAGVPAGATLTARAPQTDHSTELIGRLARVEFGDGDGEPLVTVEGVEILPSDAVDPDAVGARLEERRGTLRSEVQRGERKLANEGFVAKAPPEVVEAERAKLAEYRSELAELGG
ncbi:MAG: valine--tRNA ligase [Solirubrobacterales bacterium]